MDGRNILYLTGVALQEYMYFSEVLNSTPDIFLFTICKLYINEKIKI